MAYVDGFVIPVPVENRKAYERMAQDAAKVYRDHGALKVVECWGNDVPEGEMTSYTMAVKRKENEAVVFSWIWWASKEARDAGNAKVMADPRMRTPPGDFPFDGKRLIYGGFETIVEA